MTLPPLRIDDPEQFAWDDSADVVVLGFGAAGACAALEADIRLLYAKHRSDLKVLSCLANLLGLHLFFL